MIYPTKPFFKTKYWLILCILSQWLIELILSLPFVLRKGQPCKTISLMTIYTWTMAILLPLLINIILNSYIFSYVRSNSRRIMPHNPKEIKRIHHGDIHLFLHIIIMSSLFIIGWGPVYILSCLRLKFNLHPLIFPIAIIIGEFCLLAIIVDLYVYNHQLRRFLWNKIQQLITYCIQFRFDC